MASPLGGKSPSSTAPQERSGESEVTPAPRAARAVPAGRVFVSARFAHGSHKFPRILENPKPASQLRKGRPHLASGRVAASQLSARPNSHRASGQRSRVSPLNRNGGLPVRSELRKEGHQYFSTCSITRRVPSKWLTRGFFSGLYI